MRFTVNDLLNALGILCGAHQVVRFCRMVHNRWITLFIGVLIGRAVHAAYSFYNRFNFFLQNVPDIFIKRTRCADEYCLVCDDIKRIVGDEGACRNDGGLNRIDFAADNVLQRGNDLRTDQDGVFCIMRMSAVAALSEDFNRKSVAAAMTAPGRQRIVPSGSVAQR